MQIGIIILAGGSSSRMGESKQLLKINNETLLRKTVHAAIGAGHISMVVLGANANEHLREIQKTSTYSVFNPDWEKGMGSSLKCGLRELLKFNSQIDGVVVLVCDQPALTSEHINNLITQHRESKKPIIASRYQNTNGVPVFFDRVFFTELLMLNDTHGAKKILEEHPEQILAIPFEHGEIDLDTPEDYKNFINSLKK
jgi:molybdenum cofactor cytidylyltransferase